MMILNQNQHKKTLKRKALKITFKKIKLMY
jgi:hypothetical protein